MARPMGWGRGRERENEWSGGAEMGATICRLLACLSACLLAYVCFTLVPCAVMYGDVVCCEPQSLPVRWFVRSSVG